jgi:mRNA interferase YafQ
MLSVAETTGFRRDLKRAVKRGKDLAKLKTIVQSLADGKPLPPRNRDHTLSGDWSGCRECHIEPDWLLIYYVEGKTLWLCRTGTHSDLFE